MPDPTYGEAGPLLAWPQAVPRSSSTPWFVPRAVLQLELPLDVALLEIESDSTSPQSPRHPCFCGNELVMFLEKDRDVLVTDRVA